jgi:hypothetical protein
MDFTRAYFNNKLSLAQRAQRPQRKRGFPET